MPIDIIIYAVIAVIMAFWLRSVLGTRSEDDRQRPNPFVGPVEDKKKKDKKGEDALDIVLEPQEAPRPRPNPLNVEIHPAIDNKTAENGLLDISKSMKDFDLEDFLDKARMAFKIVVESFADGDKATLKDLLAPGVYKAFEKAIEARHANGEEIVTKVKDVTNIKVIEARLKGSKAIVTLRFTAEEDYMITDKDGRILAGQEGKITTMTDVWVFSKDVNDKDPRWFVIETRDDEIEAEGKTPMPEAK